ncbi:MAG: DUF2851 family protein, partial [Verrucomicrobiales bacterium]|nr:DUF2851 family protein [Verrucomicrobiales bacterium]
MSLPERPYLAWRNGSEPQLRLGESLRQGAPPERWLQEIWAHQRIQRERLATSDAKPVRILHPGFLNHESGPDFLKAVVQIGTGTPTTGDIEIDLRSSLWRSHGHAQNPAYANVVLHVVWDPPDATPPLPTLSLRDVLDAPVDELRDWIDGPGELPSPWIQGRCNSAFRELPPQAVADLLHQAAWVRLQTKARAFAARGRAAGWSQALREGTLRALGYKHNAWPMQRLAETLPHLDPLPPDTRNVRDAWEARLLGLSGLLPAEPKSGTRARQLWDLWWRERDALAPHALPPFVWRLNGVRPANHPQRRLALASAWIADPLWEQRLADWFKNVLESPVGDTDPEASLFEALRPEADGFWRRHYSLGTRPLPDPVPILGSGRLNDLAVNVVLPWLFARAQSVDDAPTLNRIERLYHGWSAGEDNATLKLARARLFGSDDLPFRKTAAIQQGLLQIVRDFCLHSDATCSQCELPRCLGDFAAS